MARAKTKAAFMISAVAEQYGVHPQTLRTPRRVNQLCVLQASSRQMLAYEFRRPPDIGCMLR